jgi:hypothetical protein
MKVRNSDGEGAIVAIFVYIKNLSVRDKIVDS